jgi:hypothetical protein
MLIDHLIETVASARVTLDEASAIHKRDTEEVDRLAARAEQCRARQREITGHRLADKSTSDETAEYAALSGDIPVLNELLAEAAAHAKASDPIAQRAAFKRAESELSTAQEQAAFDAVVEHTRAVERAYIECLRTVWQAAQTRGHQRTFGDVYRIDSAIMNLCRLNSFAWVTP